jgi:tetratricopeptide (TPR) repeat protein
MTDNPRIEALRRRVEKDPASIAFAQLAEEYRRAGDYERAIQICREGLAKHSGYLSAQVTLGRALIEVGQLEEARAELEAVQSVAPDNLAAIRALAEIHQRYDYDVVGSLAETLRGHTESAPQVTGAPMDQPLEIEPTSVPKPDPVLEALEQWLTAIVADRALLR